MPHPTFRNSNTSATESTPNPGVYTPISGTKLLNPGVDVITDEMRLSGNQQITGHGVTLYLASDNSAQPCSAKPADQRQGAGIRATGNGSVEGGSEAGSSGTICMKAGTLDLRGNGYTVASQIITGKITMNANPSGITVACDLSGNAAETTTVVTIVVTGASSYDATGLEA